MRVHSTDQNTNDDRDLARKRQGKKLFLSHKTLENLLKCTYTVTVIQASWHFLHLLHLHFFAEYQPGFCWGWSVFLWWWCFSDLRDALILFCSIGCIFVMLSLFSKQNFCKGLRLLEYMMIRPLLSPALFSFSFYSSYHTTGSACLQTS